MPHIEFVVRPVGPRFIIAKKPGKSEVPLYFSSMRRDGTPEMLSHRKHAHLFPDKGAAEAEAFKLAAKYAEYLGALLVLPYDPGPIEGDLEFQITSITGTPSSINVSCFVADGDHFGHPLSFAISFADNDGWNAKEFFDALGCEIGEGHNHIVTEEYEHSRFRATVAAPSDPNKGPTLSNFRPI